MHLFQLIKCNILGLKCTTLLGGVTSETIADINYITQCHRIDVIKDTLYVNIVVRYRLRRMSMCFQVNSN